MSEEESKKIEESRKELKSDLLEIVNLGNNIIKKLDEEPVPAQGDGTIHLDLVQGGEEEYVEKEPTDNIKAGVRDEDGQHYEIRLSIMQTPSTGIQYNPDTDNSPIKK